MTNIQINLLFILLSLLTRLTFIESAKKECNQKLYPNAESIVCICNITHCDNFPALQIQKSGFASVFETNKKGDRFKESSLKFEKTPDNSTNAIKKQIITLDINQKFQKLLGFGGAYTDSTGINIKSLPESLGQNIIYDYFSQNGIEYSMVRTPVAGSDYSLRNYTFDDVTDDKNLTHFALQKEDLEYKIPYMKMAQNVSHHKIKLFGSPFSPPIWIKDNGKIRSGSLKGPVGGEYYQIFADYFVKFLKAYESHGINIWGITINNEPIEGLKPKQPINGLGLYPNQERDFVKMNLGPTLEKAGYNKTNLKLMIFDENTYAMENWTDTILGDEEAAKWVSGVAFHWYANNQSTDSILEYVHKKYPEFFLLNTEACILKPPIYGNWQWAEQYAFDMIRDLNHWVEGWVDWNMVLDMEGGPSWAGTKLSSPIFVNSTAKEYYKEPIFYILGHFSKFLVPDSVRVEVKLEPQIDKLYSTAFLRPDNAIVLIVANMNSEQIELSVDESNSGYLNSKIMPHSIQSYIWSH